MMPEQDEFREPRRQNGKLITGPRAASAGIGGGAGAGAAFLLMMQMQGDVSDNSREIAKIEARDTAEISAIRDEIGHIRDELLERTQDRYTSSDALRDLQFLDARLDRLEEFHNPNGRRDR